MTVVLMQNWFSAGKNLRGGGESRLGGGAPYSRKPAKCLVSLKNGKFKNVM